MTISGRYRPRSIAVVVAAASVLCLCLAGCVNDAPAPGSKSTHTSRSSAPSTASATPATTPTSTPTPVTTPGQAVTTRCSALFTPQQVYDYNPNVVANPAYSPAAGSLQAQAVAELGRACGWIDETSNEQLTVAVATPGPAGLEASEAAASSHGGLTTFNGNDTVNFQTLGGAGTLQVFAGSFWLIISSPEFGAASDAEPTAKVILANLGAS